MLGYSWGIMAKTFFNFASAARQANPTVSLPWTIYANKKDKMHREFQLKPIRRECLIKFNEDLRRLGVE